MALHVSSLHPTRLFYCGFASFLFCIFRVCILPASIAGIKVEFQFLTTMHDSQESAAKSLGFPVQSPNSPHSDARPCRGNEFLVVFQPCPERIIVLTPVPKRQMWDGKINSVGAWLAQARRDCKTGFVSLKKMFWIERLGIDWTISRPEWIARYQQLCQVLPIESPTDRCDPFLLPRLHTCTGTATFPGHRH